MASSGLWAGTDPPAGGLVGEARRWRSEADTQGTEAWMAGVNVEREDIGSPGLCGGLLD